MRVREPNLLQTKAWLAWELSSLGYQIELLKRYVKEGESNIKIISKNFEDWADEQISKMDKSDAGEFIDFHLDTFHEYKHEYPDLFLKSTFLVAFGFIENRLREMCILIGNFKKSSITLEEHSKMGNIKDLRSYLATIIKLDLRGAEVYWSKIVEFQKLRNYITHHNSTIVLKGEGKLQDDIVYKLIKRNPKWFKFDKEYNSFKILDKEVMLNFIDVGHSFLRVVLERARLETPKKVVKKT